MLRFLGTESRYAKLFYLEVLLFPSIKPFLISGGALYNETELPILSGGSVSFLYRIHTILLLTESLASRTTCIKTTLFIGGFLRGLRLKSA
ncbi:hypothetical protein DU06_0109 [Chlamydia trachomatis]|nr:hypothetical protein DU06_0109 [Chlamydia trachomatis]